MGSKESQLGTSSPFLDSTSFVVHLLYTDLIGIMEKKMESTIMGYIGVT